MIEALRHGGGVHRLPAAQDSADFLSAAIAEFGRRVAEKSGRGGSREDQLRGPLETLLERLGAGMGLSTIPYGEVKVSVPCEGCTRRSAELWVEE